MVIIDSSKIITNAAQLLDSKYELCIQSDDDALRIIKSMPENNPLRRVIEKNKDCAIDITVLGDRLDLTNRAIFLNPMFIRSALSLYVKEKADVIYWLSKPVFDDPLVFYYRAGLTESQTKLIHSFATIKLERSLYNYFYDFPLLELDGKNVNLHIFSDLQEFIETFSVFREITLGSLKQCFGILLFCELLVFVLFLCSKTIDYLKRRYMVLSLRELIIDTIYQINK